MILSSLFRTSVSPGTATLQAYETFAHPPEEELYDLENDPIEYVNLAGEKKYEDVLVNLREQLQAWRERTADPFLDPGNMERVTAYCDAGADEQERRGARYSYRNGILFNVDMKVLYPDGILQDFS